MKEFFHEIPNKIATITEVTHHHSWYCSHESFGDLGPRSLQFKKYIVHTQLACSYAKKKLHKYYLDFTENVTQSEVPDY